MEEKIWKAQQNLEQSQLDGWLFYDFRHSNDLACQFLDIAPSQMLTRRFFYWIPTYGNPIKIVHMVESSVLHHLPGEVWPYRSWEELEKSLESLLSGKKKIAMEYSPRNAIPYLSKVDGGTLDLIRSLGVEVVSSADLLQETLSVWSDEQLQTHLEAATLLDQLAAEAWRLIATSLRNNQAIRELDVQTFMLNYMKEKGFVTADAPICSVNVHSADPHYAPSELRSSPIRKGDFVLIDLWCKKNVPKAVYADITRVAVAASKPTEKQQEIFKIVKNAQEAATEFLKKRIQAGEPVRGWEVDKVARQVIVDKGYGDYFVHRTGHSIGESDHGNGANIDNFETQDSRLLLPGTCFSIEPGIYLPNEFGVRLEYDIYLPKNGKSIQITGGIQKEIVCLLSS